MVYGGENYSFRQALALVGRPRTGVRLSFGLGKPVKPKHGKVVDWPTVTVEALKRHMKRYGNDCVAETARAHGVDESGLLELGVGGSTTERVLALASQGFVAAEIEKRLRLSRPTVRRILEAPSINQSEGA